MYKAESSTSVMQVHFQLATIKKRNTSIAEYFQQLKTLNDTLVAVGQPITEFQSISVLLASSGTEYDPFVTSITTRVDSSSIEAIYGNLLTYEMRLEHNQASPNLSQSSANMSARGPAPHGRGGPSYN
jgi:hypothetical protein